MTDHNHRSAGTEDAADFDTYWRGMYYDLLNRSRAALSSPHHEASK